MPSAQFNAAPVFFEDPLQVSAFDPGGQLGRDFGKWTVVIEVETEGRIMAGDDLSR